jgi:outer membrane protein TolC
MGVALAVLLLAELGTANSQTPPPAPMPSAAPALAAPARNEGDPTLPRPRADKQDASTPPWQKSPLERPAPPGGEAVKLEPPPLAPGDRRFPINLAAALRLADARPIVISATGATVWVAEAQLQKAKVLWIPTINFAADYIRHDGYGPDLNRGVNVPQGENALGQNAPGSLGKPLNQNVNFFYSGAGFTYTPSETNYFYQPEPDKPQLPAPQMEFVTNMIFEPLKQRQVFNASRWAVQTAKNDSLFLTARNYFDVHRYRGQYAGAIDVVLKGRQLVKEIADLSLDLVSAVEVDRARSLLADLEQQAVSARENWRVSSARLTQVLRLDPRAVVEPIEHDHMQLTLIDPSRSLNDLMPIALTNRPELAGHQAQVQAALVRIRQQKLKPWLPATLMNGFQTPFELIEVGGYGVGNGGKLNNWSGRDDISPQALWIFEQMGFGYVADVKEKRGMASGAMVELFKVQDAVVADVTRSQADVQSAAARVVQAEREVQSALINYNGNYEGLKQTRRFGNVLQQVFRPQEVVFALQLLKTAYDNYFNSVADYNIAQFELFHALGYPAREIAFFRRPGEIAPVDTARPGYLPPVGTGPPPATR